MYCNFFEMDIKHHDHFYILWRIYDMIGYPIRFVTRGSLDTDKDFTVSRVYWTPKIRYEIDFEFQKGLKPKFEK